MGESDSYKISWVDSLKLSLWSCVMEVGWVVIGNIAVDLTTEGKQCFICQNLRIKRHSVSRKGRGISQGHYWGMDH